MTEPEQTQKTKPKGKDKQGKPYEPVEIPVPKRDDVMRDLVRVAPPAPTNEGRTGDDGYDHD
jgi:hypothetical protein